MCGDYKLNRNERSRNNMTTNQKKLSASVYWIVCLILMTGEPSESITTGQMLAYYGVVLSNLVYATHLLNKLFNHATTSN